MKYRQTDTKYVAQPTLPSNPLVTKLRHFLNQLLRRRIMQNRLHATIDVHLNYGIFPQKAKEYVEL